MNCKLCGSNQVQIIYKGLIRDGGLGNYTKEPVSMLQCENCNVIWHDPVIDDLGQYYESQEYRNSLEGTSEEMEFYKKHDFETLSKFQYTGTDIFRQKVVADIGCGCGAFLDFLKGVASDIIAIEPSMTYREIMSRKGKFLTYAYAKDAFDKWKGKIDVATSFDVIEHVKNPVEFIKDVSILLKKGGKAIVGTPTDAPIMRSLLGDIYEKKVLFSTQHLWIFSEKSLRRISEIAGFQKVNIRYFQRYGIDNLLKWLVEKEPCSEIENRNYITMTLDAVWRSECRENGRADYIVLYLEK